MLCFLSMPQQASSVSLFHLLWPSPCAHPSFLSFQSWKFTLVPFKTLSSLNCVGWRVSTAPVTTAASHSFSYVQNWDPFYTVHHSSEVTVQKNVYVNHCFALAIMCLFSLCLVGTFLTVYVNLVRNSQKPEWPPLVCSNNKSFHSCDQRDCKNMVKKRSNPAFKTYDWGE